MIQGREPRKGVEKTAGDGMDDSPLRAPCTKGAQRKPGICEDDDWSGVRWPCSHQ